MKKTIGAIAMLMSTSPAFAIIAPGTGDLIPVDACLSISKVQTTDGKSLMYAGNCDETVNNERFKKPLLDNGCAAKQARFTSVAVKLPLCRDPRIVQL